MDSQDELDKILDEASYRITLMNQREHLKVKVARDLRHTSRRGIFAVSPGLIATVKLWIDLGESSMILMDVNDNPILIDNLSEFMNELVSAYTSAMNEYHEGYKRISTARGHTKRVIEAV